MTFDFLDFLEGPQDQTADVMASKTSKVEKATPPVAAPRTFLMGVVVDVFNDPAIISQSRLDNMEITNRGRMTGAPRNSILVRVISESVDKNQVSVMVAYSFFPPHLCMPLKPGETVWLINPTPGSDDLYFWMCRITAPDWVDDLNFTHNDRSFFESPFPAGKTEEEAAEDEAAGKPKEEPPEKDPPTNPGFSNGMDAPDLWTLHDEFDYEEIYTGSLANQSITFEAVPRFKKRPADLVLQGSNNTLISLGEDRGWTKNTRPANVNDDPRLDPDDLEDDLIDLDIATANLSNVNYIPEWGWKTIPPSNWQFGDSPIVVEAMEDGEAAEPREPQNRGTIDLVVGRGQTIVGGDLGPAPNLIENTREWEEVNKNPMKYGDEAEKGEKSLIKNNYYENPPEGDPDFMTDLSRIYVSMKTSADMNFGLTYPSVPAASQSGILAFESTGVVDSHTGGAAAVNDKPHVVIKSNEIRIIARNAAENGSIKIIKEGEADDDENGQGRAVIMIQPDGTIMIDGPKIIIGSGIEKEPGMGQQVAVGLGAVEPMVLGQTLEDKLNELIDALNSHTHIDGLGATGMPVSPFIKFDKEFFSLVGRTK